MQQQIDKFMPEGRSLMNNHIEEKKLGRTVVKAFASLAKGVAKDSVEATSWMFFCQPEAPKDLAKRLQVMKK